jgi:glycosyltransferase involved in cell wall biosynthesis
MTFSPVTAKFYIHAPNVHQGGGKTLLNALIHALPNNKPIVLILDQRAILPEGLPKTAMVKRVAPSLASRLSIEWWLKNNITPSDLVLCFGNLPPVFTLSGRTGVFVQNRYLVDEVTLKSFSTKTRLRLLIERLWLSHRSQTADFFVVQTPSMKKLLSLKIKGKKPVHTLPFIEDVKPLNPAITHLLTEQNDFEFVYVASGEPHKNHLRLLDAWTLLADEDIFPTLYLTLDNNLFPELCTHIYALADKYHLKIKNLGNLNHEDIQKLYESVSALIYPSYLESFGMPLVEAHQKNLPIIASELDYVRDLLNPTESFDPYSSTSIARAVKRFIKVNHSDLALINPTDFINKLFKL